MVLAIFLCDQFVHHAQINLCQNTPFLSSVLISHFQVSSGFDSDYIAVVRCVSLRQKCQHEHELQLSECNGMKRKLA